MAAVLQKIMSTCIYASAPKHLSVRFMFAPTPVYIHNFHFVDVLKKIFCRRIKARMLNKNKKMMVTTVDDDYTGMADERENMLMMKLKKKMTKTKMITVMMMMMMMLMIMMMMVVVVVF